MHDLTEYKNDAHLRCLFGAELVLFEIWVMERGKEEAPILVYSMISPADQGLTLRQWKVSDFKRLAGNHAVGSVTAKVAKASIVDSGTAIVAVISDFLAGKTLQQACAGTKCVPPEGRIGYVTLGSLPKLEKQFIVRPPITSLSRRSVAKFESRIQGTTSPHEDTTARVGSIFRLNKEILWRGEEGKLVSNAREVFRELTTKLSADTGLHFFASDAKRIGNIEFVAFPASDYRARKKVTVAARSEKVKDSDLKTCNRIAVKIAPHAANENARILVNCRLFNDNEVIADQCKEGLFPTDIEFTFEAPEPVSSGSVRVWFADDSNHSWKFWHQEDFDLFRSISVSTQFSGIPRSDWLDLLKQKGTEEKTDSDIENVALSPFANFTSREDRYFSLDPWNPIGTNVIALCKRLTPPSSSAKFFLAADGNEDARIRQLVAWLESTWDSHGPSQTCVILDPFFDEPGSEIIRQVRSQNVEIIVVTNTQCRSFDDDLSMKEKTKGEPNRAQRIRSFFEGHASDFDNRAVRVLDIRATGDSTKQYFHDRYVLLFNMAGRLERGYNLSNSFQGAMKSYPLLITTIPTDILEPVQYYVRDFLRETRTNSARQLVSLYSSHERRVARRPIYREGLLALTNPARLYADLLSDNTVEALSLEELTTVLQKLDLVTDSESFKIPTHIRQAILRSASSKNPDDFRVFWGDLAEVLARSNESDQFFASIPTTDPLLSQLHSLLLESDEYDDSITALQNAALKGTGNVAELFYNTDFPTCLTCSYDLLIHFIRVPPVFQSSISKAVDALGTVDPMLLVKVLEALSTMEQTIRRKYTATKIMERLETTLALAPSVSLLSSMSGSTNQLVRALAAMAQFHAELHSSQNPNPTALANSFSPREVICVLAEWAYQLRIRANQKGGQEDSLTKVWRESAFDYMRNNWPATNDVEFLSRVLGRVSGPIIESWAHSNYNELALPLVQAGHYTPAQMKEYWFDHIFKKIKWMMTDGHFYGPADSQATAVAAHAQISEETTIDQSVESLNTLIRKCAEQLLRPRIQIIDHSLWHQHTHSLIWAQTLLEHMLFYRTNLSTAQEKRISETIALGDSHTFDRDEVMSQERDELVVWAKRVREEQRK